MIFFFCLGLAMVVYFEYYKTERITTNMVTAIIFAIVILISEFDFLSGQEVIKNVIRAAAGVYVIINIFVLSVEKKRT